MHCATTVVAVQPRATLGQLEWQWASQSVAAWMGKEGGRADTGERGEEKMREDRGQKQRRESKTQHKTNH